MDEQLIQFMSFIKNNNTTTRKEKEVWIKTNPITSSKNKPSAKRWTKGNYKYVRNSVATTKVRTHTIVFNKCKRMRKE